MIKKVKIEGMSCGHCKESIEKALHQISGVTVKVNLANQTAVIESNEDIENSIVIQAVTDAGYEVTNID